MILNPKGPLTFEHLNHGKSGKSIKYREEGEEVENLDAMISGHIRRILSKANGKIDGADGAAAILGINPSTLRNRMKKLGIEYGRNNK